jgi:hypothetical protein
MQGKARQDKTRSPSTTLFLGGGKRERERQFLAILQKVLGGGEERGRERERNVHRMIPFFLQRGCDYHTQMFLYKEEDVSRKRIPFSTVYGQTWRDTKRDRKSTINHAKLKNVKQK